MVDDASTGTQERFVSDGHGCSGPGQNHPDSAERDSSNSGRAAGSEEHRGPTCLTRAKDLITAIDGYVPGTDRAR